MPSVTDCDTLVVGGGLVGAALALGLAHSGQRVLVVDEGDVARRASRGNFALVWVQGKGLGLPEYAAWTLESANAWTAFAEDLRRESGIDVCFRRPGGFNMALTDRELAVRAMRLDRIAAQPGLAGLHYEVIDHVRLRKLMPDIGPQVVGASFCPQDGHCNSLKLFRALHVAMARAGVAYRPQCRVDKVANENGEFTVAAGELEVRAGQLVLAAGLDNARLAPMVGLTAPVRPQRGHIAVTEKAQPFLHYPINTVRQTDEGGVMLGDSQEEKTDDAAVDMAVLAVIADRAVRMFPRIGRLNVVRMWAALRVMTPDGFPIYEASTSVPGAFVATCHSGVTLAAAHARVLAPMIAAGALSQARIGAFSARRFADVPTPA